MMPTRVPGVPLRSSKNSPRRLVRSGRGPGGVPFGPPDDPFAAWLIEDDPLLAQQQHLGTDDRLAGRVDDATLEGPLFAGALGPGLLGLGEPRRSREDRQSDSGDEQREATGCQAVRGFFESQRGHDDLSEKKSAAPQGVPREASRDELHLRACRPPCKRRQRGIRRKSLNCSRFPTRRGVFAQSRGARRMVGFGRRRR